MMTSFLGETKMRYTLVLLAVMLASFSSTTLAAEKEAKKNAKCCDAPAKQQKKQNKKSCPAAKKEKGFVKLFNGKNLDGWVGATKGYKAEKGKLVYTKGGYLRTKKEYADFILRLDYKLEPGGNNGVGIRAAVGNPAYSGMEIQILDDRAKRYAKLKPYQYNGSVYGVFACKRGKDNPPGKWNSMEIRAEGIKIRVTLNGTVITKGDLSKVKPGLLHGHPMKGLKNTQGHITFCGHGSRVEFRNIRIKELKKAVVKKKNESKKKEQKKGEKKD
jgi:hypothetical protein